MAETASSPGGFRRFAFLERKPWRDMVEINLGLFEGLLLTYLGLLLVETLREGTVTRFFPLNGLLVGVIVTGVLAALTMKEESQEPQTPLRTKHYVLIGSLAVGAWLILWYQLNDLGWIQYPVSILGGSLVGLVSLSVLLPEGNEMGRGLMPQPGAAPAPLAPAARPAPKTKTVRVRTMPDGQLAYACPRCLRSRRSDASLKYTVVPCPSCGAPLMLR